MYGGSSNFPNSLGSRIIMKVFTLISVTAIALLLFSDLNLSEGKKSDRRRTEDEEGSKESAENDRQKVFEGISDQENSAQAISPNAVNPYAAQLLQLQNQAALINNPSLYAGGLGGLGGGTPFRNSIGSSLGSGNLQNLGGGLFSNQQYQFPFAGQAGLNGNSFVNAAIGGLSAYQNPLLYGGAGIPGIGSPDIFSQSAAAAQLYNNPYLGAGGLGGAGLSSGINPLLLRGATNLQYPIVAGGGNPYLNAQQLLSPYSNYNQLNPYNNFPFASRFGIGVGRSSLGNRQTSSQSNNNDE